MGWRTKLAVAGTWALLVAGAATACSDPPTRGNVATDEGGGLPDCPLDALERADGPVEVTLWYGGIGGSSKDTMIDMAERFNASQDQIVVTPSDQGSSYEEVYRKYERTASADADQLPEILMVEDTTLQAMVDSGQVLPAEACMRADEYDMDAIEPVVRSNYTVDDIYYPGYANLTSQILYYNQAHWARAGLDPQDPPDTLDELYDAAVALKEAGVSERPLSFKVSHALFKNWLTAVGVDMVDRDNGRDGLSAEAVFDTPEARELLDFLLRMDEEGLLNVFSNTEGSIDHYLALAQQQSSMLIETSGAAQTIGSFVSGNIDPDEAGVDFDPDAVDLSQLVPAAAPFPGIEEPGRVIPGGAVFYMLNTSEPAQQAAAWKFLEFMLQPENGRRWHTAGSYLPIVSSVQDDPEVQAFWDDTLGGSLLRVAVDQVNAADPEEPGPLMGPYSDFTNIVEDGMEAVLIEGADVDSSLAGAQDDVTESLERYAGTG
jgi:sn-glycerol 3-phosphate transport system substrate-binding protein